MFVLNLCLLILPVFQFFGSPQMYNYVTLCHYMERGREVSRVYDDPRVCGMVSELFAFFLKGALFSSSTTWERSLTTEWVVYCTSGNETELSYVSPTAGAIRYPQLLLPLSLCAFLIVNRFFWAETRCATARLIHLITSFLTWEQKGLECALKSACSRRNAMFDDSWNFQSIKPRLLKIELHWKQAQSFILKMVFSTLLYPRDSTPREYPG